MAKKLYLKTGSKSVVDTMHQRELGISCDRLLVLSTKIENSAMADWENLGVMGPPQVVKMCVRTGAFDNNHYNS